MRLFKKKENKEINYLELTPKRLYGHEIKENDGLVNVLVPKFSDKILGRIIQPRLKDKYIRANLDKIGSSTWLKIDGKSNILAIGAGLTEEFGEEIQPVNQRVTTFFSQLYKAGFITFIELERN